MFIVFMEIHIFCPRFDTSYPQNEKLLSGRAMLPYQRGLVEPFLFFE